VGAGKRKPPETLRRRTLFPLKQEGYIEKGPSLTKNLLFSEGLPHSFFRRRDGERNRRERKASLLSKEGNFEVTPKKRKRTMPCSLRPRGKCPNAPQRKTAAKEKVLEKKQLL